MCLNIVSSALPTNLESLRTLEFDNLDKNYMEKKELHVE